MSYADANRISYSFPAVNFATSSSQSITGPKGKAGRIKTCHVSATTLFTAVTTQARVDLGNATTANAYGTESLGTLAAGASTAIDDGSNAASSLTMPRVAADVPIKVSFVAPTGGTPAGVGTVTVVVDWDW